MKKSSLVVPTEDETKAPTPVNAGQIPAGKPLVGAPAFLGRAPRATLFEVVSVAVLVIAFYHPLLRFGSMSSGGDAANLFWPIKLLLQDSLFSQGVVPLWNHWSYMGAPLAGSLQHAIFYPIDILLYGFLSAHVAINALNLIHLSMAGIGTWACLRGPLNVGAIPAIFCGAAYPCVAWFWGHQEHLNQIASASWLPWVMLFALRFAFAQCSARAFLLGTSAVGALQFLTGHPQCGFYAALAGAAVVLGSCVGGPLRKVWPTALATGFATAALAAMLIAVQLLITLELQSHSRRQFKDPTYALSFSLPPDVLLTYLLPHAFGSFSDGYFAEDAAGATALDTAGEAIWDRRAYGEYGLHVGLPVLLLAVIALLPGSRRRLTLLLWCGVIFTLLMALGGNTDPRRILALNFTEMPEPGYSLHELMLRLLPPLQGFRVPARTIYLTAFFLVLLSGIGLQAAQSLAGPAHRKKRVGLVLGAIIWGALYLPSRAEKFHAPVDMAPVLELSEQLRRPTPSLDDRLFRLTTGDDQSLVAERHRDTTFAMGDPIFNRLMTLQPHLNVPLQISCVDGYEEGLVPTARHKDFLYHFNRNFRQLRPDQDLLNLLGVGTIFADLPIDESTYRQHSDFSGLGISIFANPEARGAAFWRDQAAGIDLAALNGPFARGGAPLPEISGTAVSFGELTAWESTLPKLRTLAPTANSITVSPEGALPPGEDAILSMAWYPGWFHVGAQGARVPLEFLNGVHAMLPAGQASDTGWRLVFEPYAYRVGLFATALGLAIWMALFAGWLRRP